MDASEAQWRQSRLEELAKKLGGRDALARKLGYQTRAFIDQMINGHRPVTEKTIQKIDKLPGCRNWFVRDAQTLQTGPAILISDLESGYTASTGPKPASSTSAPSFHIQALADMLKPLDAVDRGMAELILAKLASNPELADELGAKMDRLLGGASDKPAPGRVSNL
jgi:hypothetical protein